MHVKITDKLQKSVKTRHTNVRARAHSSKKSRTAKFLVLTVDFGSHDDSEAVDLPMPKPPSC